MPAARVEPAVALDELDASRIAETAFAGEVARAIADGVTAFSRPAPADIARST
jgi:N-acetylmuramoyl-L-alanine amidase